MGMNMSVYVGAYVLVPHAMQDQAQEGYACSAGCGNRSVNRQTKFCSACGAPVVRRDTVIQQCGPCLAWRLKDGAYEDLFWTPESGRGTSSTLWIPNRRGYGETIDEERSVDSLDDFDPDQFQRWKTAVHQDHPHLLEDIRAQFGVEARIRAGILTYWS